MQSASPLRVAVIGHVEWVEFLRVPHTPKPGEIVAAQNHWEEAAGGGAVAAVQLARLAGSCDFYTVLGDDERGHKAVEELEKRGVHVHAVFRPEPQRRAVTFIDGQSGERTIAVIGEKMHPKLEENFPWENLKGYDAIYFTAGSPGVLKKARDAKVLVATARELPTLRKAGVALDALVTSANDAGEAYNPGDLTPPPKQVFRTQGSKGGVIEPDGKRWEAAPLKGPVVDTYGAGDSFAAGLTYALGKGLAPQDAAAFAASCAVEALGRRGAHGA